MPGLARCYRYNPGGLGWNRKRVGMRPSENHPIQSFLFYLSGDVDEVVVTNLRELIEQLAKKRRWTIRPPQFVDSTEEPADPSRDESIRTVGAVLRVYSALPPWGDRLPPEVDRAHLEEVESVIDALSRFSSNTGHEIAVELDGAQLGWIEKGSPDRSLAEGLLYEWRNNLSNH